MRYCKSLFVTTIVLLSAFQMTAAPVAAATQAAQPSWNGSPVMGHARLAPIDHLQRDFAFLAEGVEAGSTTKIRELFNELSQGIDARRPAGAVLLFDETFVPVIFVPVKDEQRLFAVLGSRFGWNFRREADGYYRARDADAETDLTARVVGPWLYVTGTSHRATLRDVPSDPTLVFEGTDPTLTAHAAFNVDRFPPEMLARLIQTFSESDAVSDRGALVNDGVKLIQQWARRLLAETKSIQFELQCFRPLEQFHVTSRLTAIEGSVLAQWIDAASRRPALFSHLASRDSILTMISSWQLDAQSTQPLLEAWERVAAKARAAVPSPQSQNQAEALLGRVVAKAVDSVAATLRQGQLDCGLVVESEGRDRIVLLAGSTLLGARALDETATELGTLLQQSADFRALNWSVGGVGDVSIHQLTVPVDDDSARALFGQSIHLAVGAGADRVYAALGGEEALGRLAVAIDRSRDDAPARGEMLHIATRLAPLLTVLDAVPGEDAENDRSVREYARQIAPYKKNDTLELSLKAENRSVEGRLRVDMGIVRMLASKIPVGHSPVPAADPGSATGTLRLSAGDQFQLEFHTDSEITTTIDGHDRLDRGIHSLTYDFHVVQVDPDGAMHIQTSLSRARIDKTSPEGREAFDTRNLPEPDKMTLEMMLYGVIVGQPFVLTVRPDGTIAELAGINEAIERILETQLQPSAAERERVRSFVAQSLNEPALRDCLTRGFEFYPGRTVSVGDRWTRTSENLTAMNFLLDNRYQVKALTADDMAISVRSQVREPDRAGAVNQPIQFEFVGTQSGTIAVDPRNGRLRLAEYTLRMDAEATYEMEGRMVSRPTVSVFKMTIGAPRQVAEAVSGSAPVSNAQTTAWIELTGDAARAKWRPSRPEAWLMEGNEIISRGGAYTKWSYCEYADRTFTDFELTADVLYAPASNGGICVRATNGGLDGMNPSGYEVQLLGLETNRNPTGSIYKMPTKGQVSGVYSTRPGLARPNQWFSVRIVAQGTQLTVYVGHEKVAAYDDARNPIGSGHIILQGSPEGVIRYKDVRIRPL